LSDYRASIRGIKRYSMSRTAPRSSKYTVFGVSESGHKHSPSDFPETIRTNPPI
jgi:hypothetical protein